MEYMAGGNNKHTFKKANSHFIFYLTFCFSRGTIPSHKIEEEIQ